ncbi:MAG: metallophosphoesterase family protein [Planctomycetaceae bacterium]
MPMTLPPISRRRFLAGTLAAGAGWLAGRPVFAADERQRDPHRFALLADTHVPSDHATVVRGACMSENLRRVGGELLTLDERPAAVFIDGDCAYLTGESQDYANLVELLQPIREGGLPVHLALGNHDHRERFWQAIPAGDDKPIETRHLTVIESPRADWILLDSLDVTNKTPGVLGEEQLAWLGGALDKRRDKPAIVVLHHNPDDRPNTGGLTDTAALMNVLRPRKQAKAVVFGHTHVWSVREQEGVHLINLPPVAYVFRPDDPNGWVDARLKSDGLTLQLRCHDPQHQQHREAVELTWRA